MKLVHFPGACSFARHVTLREAGLPFTLVRYERDTHLLEGGGRLEEVNDKDTFTIADAYLLTMVNWMRPAGLDPNRWPGLKEYRSRLSQRPSVHTALAAEGLLKRG